MVNGRLIEFQWVKSFRNIGDKMAKKPRRRLQKRQRRSEFVKAHVRELRAHAKARTPVKTIATAMKRTEGSLRQKVMKLGIRLGHRR